MAGPDRASAARLVARAPGKLMIAGEYAVLEPHAPAVVVAVKRYVTATIALAEENRISIPGFGLEEVPFRETGSGARFGVTDDRLRFVGEAIGVALAYVRDQFLLPLPFALTLESELEDERGRKFGLGGSAAATVATVAAVLGLLTDEGDAPAPGLIFKLAAIAHLKAQGGGSGADVAASAFGGWLRYASFQPEWLLARLDRPIDELVSLPWPFFSVEPLPPPSNLALCVGWTGAPASTAALIPRVRALREQDPAAYERFLRESREAVEALVLACRGDAPEAAIAAIAHNRAALVELGHRAGVAIETPALSELARWADVCGGAGKPSGAGGGDCGIALVPGAERASSLEAAWVRAGLEPLRLEVAHDGVEYALLDDG